MPRIRTIKPQFWTNEDLGTVSREARLLYIGLWNLSDDKGVFEYRPGQIKVTIFPYDNDITTQNVQSWLSDLEKMGNIKPFSAKGKKYGYIPTFLEHQEIKNPSKWVFAPIPPELTTPIQDYLNPTPVLPQEGVSPTSREKEKEKEKEKLIVKGKDSGTSPPSPNKTKAVKTTTIAVKNTTLPKNGKTPNLPIIMEGLENLRGYPSGNYGAEAKAAKQMLAQKYSPTDILTCYEFLKKQDFWKDKSLKLMSVANEIGDWKKRNEVAMARVNQYRTGDILTPSLPAISVKKGIAIAEGKVESLPDTKEFIIKELKRQGIKFEGSG